MFTGEPSGKGSLEKLEDKKMDHDKSRLEKEGGHDRSTVEKKDELGAVAETQQDVKNLKGSFEEQQAMIGQLREMLKNKEASKKQEKEIEDYATRLAKMKPRLTRRRGRERVKDKDVFSQQDDQGFLKEEIVSQANYEKSFIDISKENIDDGVMQKVVKPKEKPKDLVQSSIPQQESNTRTRILLLRKQLEENRIKFERQQRENLDKRAAMEDMKERIEKLRMEVEQRDTLIQSLREVDSLQQVDPNVQHLYQQILHKDNAILELTDTVNHLESVIHDQLEQINEKNQVITARTEAVTLITKDKDEKLIKTIQELEDVKMALKDVHENHSHKEKVWKEKEALLEDNIALSAKKISVMEDNYQRIEGIRFELSARNAELQEKLVSMQCDIKTLRKQLRDSEATSGQRDQESEELKKKLTRAEAFGQKKLKALEKQIKSLSSGEADFGGEILELQNKIAELEEEKGNLQLKLVDFDEIKLQNEKLSESMVSCETKIEMLNSEITSQISTITQHEKEKISLIADLNSKDLAINKLEDAMSKQLSELEGIKQSKITLELRLCEIEEERDLAQKEKKELENEFVKANEFQNTITTTTNYEELKKCIAQLEEKESSIIKLQELINYKDTLIGGLEEQREEKQNENQCLISFLAEKENQISSQSIILENHDSLVKSLHQEMSSKDNDIKNLHIQNESLQRELDSLNAKLSESDRIIKELHNKVDSFKDEVDANKNSISLLETAEQTLRSVVKEKENMLLSFETEISTLRDELSIKNESISGFVNKIDHMDSVLQSREKEILNLESEIADKLREISQQETKCKKCEEELGNLKCIYQETESKFKSECEVISLLLADKENQIQSLNEDLEIKMTELKNSGTMCSKFEHEICEKNKLCDSLSEEKQLLLEEISKLKEEMHDLEYNSNYKINDITILQQSLEEKCSAFEKLNEDFIRNLEILKSKEETLIFTEAQNKSLENELQNLRSTNETIEYQLHEIKNNLVIKENECSSVIEILRSKELEINELKESLSATSHAEFEMKDYQTHIHNLQSVVSEKEGNIKELEKEIEIYRINVSEMNQNIIYLQTESEKYKSQAEELSLKLEQSVQDLSQHLDIKEQEILHLQMEIEKHKTLNLLSEDISAVKQFSENEISQLQQELANKNAEVQYLRETKEIELENIKSQNMKLENDLASTLNILNLKEREFADLKRLYDDQSAKISFEECEKSHIVSSYTEELDKLKNRLSELETSKSNLEKEIAKYKTMCFDNSSLHSQSGNTSYKLSSEILSDNLSVESELYKSNNEEFEICLKENMTLKKQLEEAQQAIIRLETNLATEANKDLSSQEGMDEWGIVDLGEPSISDHSKLSMQTSLMEKDKALTVTQEQLKIALEDVNAANDEKKIVQHQMNTLEAELSHKDKVISDLESKIFCYKNQITEMQKKSSSPVTVDTGSQQKSSSDHYPENYAKMPVEDDSLKSYSEQSAAACFKTYEPDARGADIWETIQNVDQKYSESEQVLLSEAQDLGSDEHLSLGSREVKETQTSPTPNQLDSSLNELQYKLSWYEENWSAWTEHYTQLQMNLQSAEEQIVLLNKELETLRNNKLQIDANEELKIEKAELEDSITKLKLEKEALDQLNLSLQSQLEKANQEIYRLKNSETQLNELQGQLQTLQHQCSVLETKANDSEENATKVREYEILYGEIQTCMQEAETKREGSKSRVQELELMVQSAESEIARLRQDLAKLTSAGKSIEEERDSLQVEVENTKEELRKASDERERLEKENDRLQREMALLQSQSVELQDLCQRNRGEIDQLKSEVEILEGDSERNRTNYEIIESDLLRLRHEQEGLTQNYQILVAEKESLETEIQRLVTVNATVTFERDHIRGEAQRISEVATSAESEITRLKLELENLNMYPSKYKNLEEKYSELEVNFHELKLQSEKRDVNPQDIQLEEVDWDVEATIEHEHFQRSNVDKNFQELNELKQRVFSIEKEKNELDEEIQTQKLKNGKLIQKLKAANNKNENLLKEIQKLKAKAEGFSDLDMALEEEWKSRVSKVESERDELKIKADELEKEKNHMKTQLDVLVLAQDKYIQLKESQDDTIRSLSSRNESLGSQITSLEWKISELEENLQLQNQSYTSQETQIENSFTEPFHDTDSTVENLKQKINSLEEEIQLLKSENTELIKENKELQSRLREANDEKAELISLVDDLKDAKSKLETNCNSYKTSYLELHTDHETLQENVIKLNKELESLKDDQSTLKSAYDVLYEEYHQLQENRDSVRLELGIINGERDKLQEEVYSLKNQLQALQEEEEEEIIRGLQDECADLREQNNNLKDEIIKMNESVRQMEETVERTKNSLEQESDIQDYLRNEIFVKNQQNNSYSATINEQEQQLKYMKAEIAALKSKSSQQQQALEMLEPENEKLKKTLELVQEQNNQLSKQVEAADVSLVKLATRSMSNSEGEERFSSLEATELEAALSSLHIRDLRCQQLSIEINKLLEERDGLQLKLSASIRQNQDLTRELSLSQQLPSPQSSMHSLSEKLAELRDLNSSLERKALDGFKGSNVVGALPPSPPTFVSHTAPATPTAMRHLNYTVTRENQGASSTIMNWLLGKSTPKVLHV